MSKGKPLHIYQLTLGALYIALFALAGNIPLFSAIYIIPNVPVTLQTFLIAMMGLTLGFRGGLMSYAALMLTTFCGLPMMSGGRGGPAVFVGPSSGYIYGWVFIVALLGLYSSLFINKIIDKKVWNIPVHLPLSFLIGMVGILLDYVFGTLGLITFGADKTMAAFPVVFVSNFAFLPGDVIKIGLASLLSLLLFSRPSLRRILHFDRASV